MKKQVIIASTTHTDSHHEKFSKEALDSMAEQVNSKYKPYLIDHDPNRQIGVVLCGKVRILDDNEYGLFAVIGIFENAEEAKKYELNCINTEWQRYIYILENASTVVESQLQYLESYKKDDIATLLETHLDSTAIWTDGRVYKIKRLIASTGDLEFHVFPKDHYPPHFHVISKQRGINVRFHIHTLEVISSKAGKVTRDDVKKIKNFFETHPVQLKKLRDEHERMR